MPTFLSAVVPLPPSIAAPRRELRSASFGRVSYYEDDTSSGPPVLLLHDYGFTGSCRQIREVFDLVRQERPVVAPDLPGCGLSAKDTAPHRASELAQFVVELVRDVAARYGAAVDVVAFGRTCHAAAKAALQVSPSMRSLAFVGPGAFAPVSAARRVARETLGVVASAALGASWVGAAAHRVLSTRPALRAILGHGLRRAPASSSVEYAYEAAHQPGMATAAIDRTRAMLAEPWMPESDLDGLRCAVCFVLDFDKASASTLASAVARNARMSKRAAVRDAGSPAAAPATMEALRSFWRGLAARPVLRLIRGEKVDRKGIIAMKAAIPARTMDPRSYPKSR